MCEPAPAGDFIESNSHLPQEPNLFIILFLRAGDMFLSFWIHSLNLKSKIAILKLITSLLRLPISALQKSRFIKLF